MIRALFQNQCTAADARNRPPHPNPLPQGGEGEDSRGTRHLFKLRVLLLASLTLMLMLAATGCVTKAQARREAQAAFFAGKKAALAEIQAQSVVVKGPVQNPSVPWVAGLTLSQAIATANYLGAEEPRVITLTRQGESAIVAPDELLNGAAVPLEPGDVIEIR